MELLRVANTMLQDFRVAMRMLWKNKAWSLVAVITLTLGLGANIAIFSVVGLMLSVPLPYPNADRLVYVPQTNAKLGFSQASVSLRDVEDWGDAEGIASLAAYRSRPMAMSGEGEPQHLPAMQVTPSFLATLNVKPALGRDFNTSEDPDSEARVAILSHAIWSGLFKGETGALGREIRLDGRNYLIVGVMPQGFHFLYRKCDVWVPLHLPPEQRERGWRSLSAVARLRPGVSLRQAASQLDAISARVAREDPKNGKDWRAAVRPIADRVIPKGARASAGAMFGAVGFVLLIACANVASLQLARGMLRRREFALRASLGAGRSSLIRLQLAESLLLSLIGGAAGVLISYWTVPLLKRVAPPEMDIFNLARVDLSALGFALAISVGSGIIFGIIPAMALTRGSLAESLQDSSRGSTGGRHIMLKSLVVAEMTLALVLVSGGAMMIRSLIRQQTIDPGFDRSNLTGAHILLSAARYAEPQQVAGFYSRILENLQRDATVEAAALVQTLPLAGDNSYLNVRVEGQSDPRKENTAGNMIVSPGYFGTLRIPMIAGREFTQSDHADAGKVAVVNETFARRFWPNDAAPLGRRLRVGSENGPWLTVVGIARDVRHNGLTDPPRAEFYRPHAQIPERTMMLIARARKPGESMASAIRAAVWQVDRDQPLFRLQSLEDYFMSRSAGALATTKVLGGLAVIALLLAAIGTYSVMAYTAAQRMREIGIRLALGADAQSILGMVLKGGLTLAALGLTIGLPAAYGVTPLLRMTTEALEAQEASVYIGVSLLLFTVALAASLAPALRAVRVDPASVLRAE